MAFELLNRLRVQVDAFFRSAVRVFLQIVAAHEAAFALKYLDREGIAETPHLICVPCQRTKKLCMLVPAYE